MPVRYMAGIRQGRRSQYLVELFHRFVDKESSIFEIGCNVGRNLCYLYNAGYESLGGVEISETAHGIASSVFAGTDVYLLNSPIENTEIPEVDTIFTMAVLMHIHPDSQEIFEYIASRTSRLILIEDEKSSGPRHHGRNYRKVFGEFGFKHVFDDHRLPGLSHKYIARVLSK